MTISFNPIPGKLFDLIQVIKYGVNHDSYDRIVALSGIAPDPAVMEATQTVWQPLDEDAPGACLLFSRMQSPECFMSRYYFGQLSRFASADDLIADFASLDRRQLQRDVLSYLDKDDHKDSYYDKLIADPGALYAFTQALEAAPVLKWEVTSLINAPDPLIDSVATLMTAVAQRLAEVYRKNSKDIDNFEQRFETKIRQDPATLRDEFSHIDRKLSREDMDRVVCSCSFMHETTLNILRQQEENCVHLILGINYQKVLGTHYVDNDPINLDATLKALSDSARLKILQMLAIQDMYVAEIAQAIDKGMSTTSYHLDLLHYAGLVISRTEGKRTYYVLDRENFQKRLELLQHFVGVRE